MTLHAVVSWQASAVHGVTRQGTRWNPLQAEHEYPVLLEYAKASFERIKQRLRHLWALAHGNCVPNEYPLVSDLDRQFSDVPVGLRKILLSMIHGFAPSPAHLDYLLIHDTRMNLLSARSPTQATSRRKF